MELRRQEHLIPIDGRLPDRLADRVLVSVRRGGIDVSIPYVPMPFEPPVDTPGPSPEPSPPLRPESPRPEPLLGTRTKAAGWPRQYGPANRSFPGSVVRPPGGYRTPSASRRLRSKTLLTGAGGTGAGPRGVALPTVRWRPRAPPRRTARPSRWPPGGSGAT